MIYVYIFISLLTHLLFFVFITIRTLKKEDLPIEIEVKTKTIHRTSRLISIQNLKPGPSGGTGDKFNDEVEKNNAITEANSSDLLCRKEYVAGADASCFVQCCNFFRNQEHIRNGVNHAYSPVDSEINNEK
jgi:hypothetical protein